MIWPGPNRVDYVTVCVQAMSRPAYSAIMHHAPQGRPALVFVPSRKHARMQALDLLTNAAADGEPARFRLAEQSVGGPATPCALLPLTLACKPLCPSNPRHTAKSSRLHAVCCL